MESEKKKRLPRNKRISDPPPMRLTERDIEILKTVYEWRIMKGDQIQQLFFGSQSTASFRLSRLYQHGFLERHFLPTVGGPASSPTIYTIGKQGIEVLKKEGFYNEASKRKIPRKQLSPLFLEHTLAINDVRVAVTVSTKQHGYVLEIWLDDVDLKVNYDIVVVSSRDGNRREVSLIPDSYFVLRVPQGRACFFLEIDRGTETLSRFEEKVRAYEAYVRTGQYKERFGTRSLRILTVACSNKRLSRLLRCTLGYDISLLLKFTTLENVVSSDILTEPIWQDLHLTSIMPLIHKIT